MMTDAEVLAAVEAEERNSLGWGDGELSHERETMLRYYNQELYGNEVEGRSQIVTSEVQDTVEWMLPSLLKVFTASEKAVEFSPQGPEDEEGAEQATTACNYVFYRQNPGFTILYTMFKDALIQKNGYVKVYYEKSERKKKERYQGLTDMDLAMLLKNEGIKVLEHTAYSIGPNGYLEQEDEPQAPQPGQPGEHEPNEENAQNAAQMLHDVVIEITDETGKVCMEPVPPEEILVSQTLRSVDVQQATFFAHRRKMTISELNEMGYDTDDIGTDTSWVDLSREAQARREFGEETLTQNNDGRDPSMRRVWVTEAYIRMDVNEDGKTELLKVVKTAHKVLEREEVEVIPFAAITPIIMTHRHFGKSLAEVIADLQLIKSTITRQVLDNVYFTNSPRMAVLSNADGNPMANLDDLLTVRPGGVVREYAPGAVRNLEVPFMGVAGINTLEYLDSQKEKRTGVTSYNQGVDADSLNKTAHGISQIMGASQQRIELVARIFAETGVKQIFRLILMNLSLYHGRELSIRLNNEWTSYDPRNWNTEMDMTINVGLGTGNKDQQLAHLTQIAQAQFALAGNGGMGRIVTEKNLYNVQAKIAENAGFKNVEEFWTDPEKAQQQPQQQPNPQAQAEQMKMQAEQSKMQAEMQMRQQEQHMQMQIEQGKAQRDHQAEQNRSAEKRAELETEMAIETMRIQSTAQMEAQKFEYERAAQEAKLQNERAIAEMKAQYEQDTELKKTALMGAVQVQTASVTANQQRETAAAQGQESKRTKASEAGNQSAMNAILATQSELLRIIAAPKQIERDKNGKATLRIMQ